MDLPRKSESLGAHGGAEEHLDADRESAKEGVASAVFAELLGLRAICAGTPSLSSAAGLTQLVARRVSVFGLGAADCLVGLLPPSGVNGLLVLMRWLPPAVP